MSGFRSRWGPQRNDPRHATRDDRGTGAAPDPNAALEFPGAWVARSAENLLIQWEGGGHLVLPMAWCEHVDVLRAGDAGTLQLSCRFSLPAGEGTAGLLTFRMSVPAENEALVQDLALRLRTPVPPDPPAEDSWAHEDPAPEHPYVPREPEWDPGAPGPGGNGAGPYDHAADPHAPGLHDGADPYAPGPHDGADEPSGLEPRPFGSSEDPLTDAWHPGEVPRAFGEAHPGTGRTPAGVRHGSGTADPAPWSRDLRSAEAGGRAAAEAPRLFADDEGPLAAPPRLAGARTPSGSLVVRAPDTDDWITFGPNADTELLIERLRPREASSHAEGFDTR